MPRKSTMKKSNDNILNCLVMAYAQNFKNCSNSDEQKSNDIKNKRGVSNVELEV